MPESHGCVKSSLSAEALTDKALNVLYVHPNPRGVKNRIIIRKALGYET